MSRTSLDTYKTKDGRMLSAPPGAPVPSDAKLYTGYNYNVQKWYYKGSIDNRTVSDLQR